jgi:dihydrofolate reductase
MLIKARMGMSVDGFVGTTEGMPVFAITPGFEPGVSHGYPEFIEGCDAAVMGRNTFLPALGAPQWPWPGLQVYVLTSGPLPPQAPRDVIAMADPAALAQRLRSRPSGGDVHLVGGVRTIRAFHEAGALDRLEIVVLPVLLGQGTALSPAGAPPVPLRLLRADRTFPDGSAELVYAPGA